MLHRSVCDSDWNIHEYGRYLPQRGTSEVYRRGNGWLEMTGSELMLTGGGGNRVQERPVGGAVEGDSGVSCSDRQT